jgi:hypothetical protein
VATLMTNLGIMERARKLLNAASRRASKQEAKKRKVTEATKAKRSNDTSRSNPQPIWMETEARVTECHHELSRLRASALRVTEDPDDVIVSFTYYAHAQIYYDEIRSQVEIAQGEAFSIYYNALNPRIDEQARAIGYRHPRFHTPLDPLPWHNSWVKLALKCLHAATTLGRVRSKPQAHLHQS